MTRDARADARPPGARSRVLRAARRQPLVWTLGAALCLAGLGTTAQATALGTTATAVGSGAAAVTRCAPSAGLAVTPVLVSTPSEVVAYRVTAVSVTGASGCAGGVVSVTVRGVGDAAVVQVSGVVPAGPAPVVIALPAPLDPTAWLGWSASVSAP